MTRFVVDLSVVAQLDSHIGSSLQPKLQSHTKVYEGLTLREQ